MKTEIIFPLSMPSELRDELLSWQEIYTSPYGLSYYNMPGKSWTNTPEGSLRVADHWNFESYNPNTFMNGVHCRTNIPVPADSWVIARYLNGVYEVVKVYPKERTTVIDGKITEIISESVTPDGIDSVQYAAHLDGCDYLIWYDYFEKKLITKILKLERGI